MITHVSLIGHAGEVIAEIRPAPLGAPDAGETIALTLGPSIVVHLDLECAESVAEALIDAITTRDDVVTPGTGPVAYVPMWHPV
jgi:hypothetical protein